MSDLLGIGASAIATYANALGVVGDNVANAETPGYARRDVAIDQSAAAYGSPLYRSGLSLGGSDATGILRAWDMFKASDARAAGGEDGRAAAAANWLDAGEGAIDASDTGVGATISGVFTAATTLAADPTSATARAQMLGALGDAANAIGGAGAKLAQVSAGIGDAAAAAVKGVNDDLAALAKVNGAIARAGDGSDAKATLADQRDQLLDDLAGKVGIDTRVAADGSATVTLAGNGGAVLLSGTAAGLVSLATAGDGRLAFSIGLGGDGHGITPTSGTLAGLADAANGVAGARAGLDAIADDFATRINAWNGQGRTAGGAPGQPLLSAGGGAAGLALVATSGAAIAAAGADGSANGNLLALSDLRGPDGAEERLASLVGTNAQALASAKAQASAAATRKSAALVARDDVSGVSLDREAADLVRYQQAYAGSAKVIQAAQTSLQAILALF